MAGPRWRVIVDNDFAGDPDGLVSLAHVLLTDDVRVELITSTPVDPVLAHLAGIDPSATASLGARTAHALLEVLDATHHDIVAGAEDFAGASSPAARAIVEVCARPTPTCRWRSSAAVRSPMWLRRSPSSRAFASA